MEKEFKIGKTKIGGNNPCFIVAEIGINFDGRYEIALALIDEAAKARCNAVKFQLFRAERMYPKNAGQYRTAKAGKKDIWEIVRQGELPADWLPKLRKYAGSRGLEFFSSVCDEKSADILEKCGTDAFKITSYEITHIPLLKHVAAKKKPVVFSCGGATLAEVNEAMEVLLKNGSGEIVLMHCIARYPAPLESLNLRVISAFRKKFSGAVIGYSDHSSDPERAPRAAVALGAKVIEKHITLSRNLPGPDHSFALEPAELRLMVKTIRETEEKMRKGEAIIIEPILLGTKERKVFKGEKYVRDFAYRCIFAAKDIKKGEKFNKENLVVLRPGMQTRGIEPKYLDLLIKKYIALKDIPANQTVDWRNVKEQKTILI